MWTEERLNKMLTTPSEAKVVVMGCRSPWRPVGAGSVWQGRPGPKTEVDSHLPLLPAEPAGPLWALGSPRGAPSEIAVRSHAAGASH